MRVFNFLLVILGVLIFFFWCEGQGGFALVNFENLCFTSLKFQSLQFFFLSYCGFLKKHCVKFRKGGEGVFAFLLVNIKSYLFSYFEVPKSSIFLLVILGVFNVFFGVRGGGFALVDFESFLFYYFEIPKFSICFLVILWVFKKNCVKFCKRGEGVFAFLVVNFEFFLFLYFEVPKSLIFFLSFWGFSNFFVWRFTSE